MKAEFYRKKLSNGLTVLFEKRKLPIINTALGYRYGSGYEPAEYKGIAHYIEHCLFQGTKDKDSKQISTLIEGRGGIINAFTSDEATVYWNKIPSKYLGLSVNILKEMVSSPAFDKDKLEKEKAVVLEEAKMYHDAPDQYVVDGIKSYLFGGSFGMEAVGNEKTISGFSRESIQKFFPYYNNPILSVVGNAEFSEILELAKDIPSRKNPVFNLKIDKRNKSEIQTRNDLKQSHIALGFHTPNLKDKERYAVEAFNSILADGMSSRMFQEIRDKKGLAYVVRGVPELGTEYGYLFFYAGTEKKNVKSVKEIMLKEIKEMQALDKKELEDCKEHLIGRYEVVQESSHNIALTLIEEEMAGDAEEFYRYEERINALNLEDVRKLGKLKDYSFLALVPK